MRGAEFKAEKIEKMSVSVDKSDCSGPEKSAHSVVWSMHESQKHIFQYVRAFEKQEGVQCIFVAESSSRTIGSAHAHSDHDIVAIYVQKLERYLSMQPSASAKKKVYPKIQSATRPYMPEVEMTAWDIKHAFRLLSESALALLDAFYSPLIYMVREKATGDIITPSLLGQESNSWLPHWVIEVRVLKIKKNDHLLLPIFKLTTLIYFFIFDE